MHDVVTDAKPVDEARRYSATEFLDARRNKPTPYMEKRHFQPGGGKTADPDERVLSDNKLEKAKQEGS
jgi:hypothetical protein